MTNNDNQPVTSPAKRLCIGKIATAHGVRGLVKVIVYADDPYLLNGAHYTSDKSDTSITLKMKNSMGKYWLAEIEGVQDRTDAEKMRGTEIWITRDILPETPADEDEFYIEDLIGLNVFTLDNKAAGHVLAVENFGAGDLLEVQPPTGKSVYIAFTKDNVPDINIAEGRITIKALPDG